MEKTDKMNSDDLSKSIQESVNKDVQYSAGGVDPFLKYIGGKGKIAAILQPYIPEHKTYIEPFLGSGAMFFRTEPRAQTNVLNDYNGDLANLFVQLRDNRDKLIEMVWLTPFSEETHRKIYKAYLSPNWQKLPPIHRALGFYFIMQNAWNESVKHLRDPAWKFQTGKAKWTKSICNELFVCSNKLDGVFVLNRHYGELIDNPNLNKEDSFYYLDPPYSMAVEKGYYKHNFTPSNHHEFALMCKKIVGKFMISYDPHPMILEIFKEYNIREVVGFPKEIMITNY